jgi:formate dehydrogenase major subunit
VPGCDLSGIQHGLAFMRQVNDTGRSDSAGPVVVIGGGFTAMDCARTAQRLHGGSVQVMYRRSRAEMPVTTEELAELEHEGIPLACHVAPIGFRGNDDGHVCAVQCVRTEPGLRDAGGRYRPEPVAGSEFEVPAATVLLATGQFPDTRWIDPELRATLVGEAGWLTSGKAPDTAHRGVFVAGDFALGATTLIDAIGHAKTCARQVDTYLMGADRFKEVVVIEPATALDRDMEADCLSRHPMPMRPLPERTLHAEVERGYRESEARQEASRCYLCNYKFEIDNDLCIYCNLCLKHKPVENCIVKVRSLTYDDEGRITGYHRSTGHRDYNLLYIDQNECTRCGICAEVCPVECIPLQDIGKRTVPVAAFAAETAATSDPLRTAGMKP